MRKKSYVIGYEVQRRQITSKLPSQFSRIADGSMLEAKTAAPAVRRYRYPAQASLIIESTPAGADIEIDGSFFGNTPSTVSPSTTVL